MWMRTGQLLRCGMVLPHVVCIYVIYVCMWVSVHLQHGVDEVCWEWVSVCRRQDFMQQNPYPWFSCKHAVAFKHLCLWVETAETSGQSMSRRASHTPDTVCRRHICCKAVCCPFLTRNNAVNESRTVLSCHSICCVFCCCNYIHINSIQCIPDSLLRSHELSYS